MTTTSGSLTTMIHDGGLTTTIHGDDLTDTLLRQTESQRSELASHLSDPMATDSRAAYVGWLRRQATAWVTVPLPSVTMAALDWPLVSVRPQCLDVVGLLIADLRELSPAGRLMSIPRQLNWTESAGEGLSVASAFTCLFASSAAARLLAPAQGLTAGLTRVGSATRYLEHCSALAARVDDFGADLDRWAVDADRAEIESVSHHVVAQLTGLLTALQAGRRTGW